MRIKILSIVPRFSQLRIIPGIKSPLYGIVDKKGEILSYDNQRNYPLACASYATARMLQSALPKDQIEMSVLNLAAVPRKSSLEENWQAEYLSGVLEEIPYGKSVIQIRAIGAALKDIPEINGILKGQSLIVVPTPFETHIDELCRIAAYAKSVAPEIPLFTSGTGVWGHENRLLNSGYDYVYAGSVQDEGEKILSAILEGDQKTLSMMPGMNFLSANGTIANPAPRSFRQTLDERASSISRWKKNLANYYEWTTPTITMVGRPDLTTGSGADPLLEYCCSFQDLSTEVVAKQSKAGLGIVFAADEIVPVSGCPRECNFCHAAGAGFTERSEKYIVSLLRQYAKWGATDIIPTDDQVVLAAANNPEAAKRQIRIFRTAQELGMRLFFGNGVEPLSLLKIFLQAKSNPIYTEYTDIFLDRMGYLQLPLEEEAVVVGRPTQLRKLAMGISGFSQTLAYIDQYNRHTARGIEIATNIIMNPLATATDMRAFYERMEKFSADYPSLTRATVFHEIASSCAPHIQTLSGRYWNAAREHPVLKLVSVPQLAPKDKSAGWLENQLATYLRIRNEYATRRLVGGTYR